MAAEATQLLRTAKQALQEELITQDDYNQIKTAYTKAQMIRAGLDAGFITEGDFLQARNSFLQSLDFNVHVDAGVVVAPSAAAAAQQAPQQLTSFGSGPQARGVASSTLPRNGSGPSLHNAYAAAPAPARAAPAAPAPAPAAAMMMMAAAAGGGGGIGSRASSGPGAAASAAPQSTSGELPGTIPIPTDLHRIGRAGVAQGKKSMSGIALNDSCINLFNHIKTRSSYKWVTFKIDDAGAEVVVDQLGGPHSTYDECLGTLPPNQCRYAVFDCAFSNQDTGQIQQKLVFIHWAPTSSSTKSKMMYASTKEFLKGYLEGVGAELQADTVEELQESELLARIAASMARK